MDGQPINAHAGGVLYEDGSYYWFGQHLEGKTWTPEANRAPRHPPLPALVPPARTRWIS